jgi:hypothetical protein
LASIWYVAIDFVFVHVLASIQYLAIDTQKEIKSGELSQVGKGRLN